MPTSGDAVHILLFGMPGAAKSSLLGALAEAAQKQEYYLNGRLVDRSGGSLAELQKRLYEGHPRPTAEAVVCYLVEFQPFAQSGNTKTQKQQAVLMDCDGRIANHFLSLRAPRITQSGVRPWRRKTLSDSTQEGRLAREFLEADTLVLAIDAAAPPPQVDTDFVEFGNFLRLLELNRGQRSEVGGLPVFLVLTKCDLLAQPNDTPVDLYERIEERKRQVHHRFQAFLARQKEEERPMPFGRIELTL